MAEGGESDRSHATDGSSSLTTSTGDGPSANPTDWEPVVEEEEEEKEEEEEEEEDWPIETIERPTGHTGWAEGEDVRPDEEDVGRDRLNMTNLFLRKEVWAKGHSAIRDEGERSLGYQFARSNRKYKSVTLVDPYI